VDIRYLEVEEVLRLHLLEVGEGVGLRDRVLLEAAVERPRQSAFGDDAYPTIETKAAALLGIACPATIRSSMAISESQSSRRSSFSKSTALR
jgi:hypothetical protein